MNLKVIKSSFLFKFWERKKKVKKSNYFHKTARESKINVQLKQGIEKQSLNYNAATYFQIMPSKKANALTNADQISTPKRRRRKGGP